MEKHLGRIDEQLIARNRARIAAMEVELAECHPDDKRRRADLQKRIAEERRLLDFKHDMSK